MTALFGFALSEVQILILVVIGVLLFGRKLPEIGRSLGKGIVEFKKGLKGMEDEVDGGMTASAPAPAARQEQPIEQPRPPQRITASAPKFDDAPKFEDTAPKFEQPAPPSAPPQV